MVTTVRQRPFFLRANAGEHRYEGFETGARWSATKYVTTHLDASFYRDRLGHFIVESDAGVTVLTGSRLPISPDRVINGGANFSPATNVTLTFDVKDVGAAQLDQRNTFDMEPETLFDATVTWRRGGLRITLATHNLFNEEYFRNGAVSSGDSADIGRPRQLMLTTSFVFR